MIARAIVAHVDESTYPARSFVAWGPLFHMGATDQVFATLIFGGKAIMVDGFDAPALMDIIARESVGCFPMPGIASRVLAAIKDAGIRPKPAGIIGSMADLVPRAELAELTTIMQAPFRNTFGSTETGLAPASRGRVPIGAAPERLPKTQSSLCRLRLVNEAGEDVPDGEPGEAALRTPCLFSGYWSAPEANAAAFRGSWYHMGDILRRNPNGTLDFVDRRSYLIKSGGESIFPGEIERLLMADARIEEAVVVRRADGRWGEVPVAFVVRRDPQLTETQVIAACRGQIAEYKVPKTVRFITAEAIPRSVQGKVQRQALEAMLPTARA
jgi:fatty-acyl-CoA synthase